MKTTEILDTPEKRADVFEKFLEHLNTYPEHLFYYVVSHDTAARLPDRYPNEFPNGKQQMSDAQQARRRGIYDTIQKNATGEFKGNSKSLGLLAYNVLKWRDAPQQVEQVVEQKVDPISVEIHEKQVLSRDEQLAEFAKSNELTVDKK
jgi:hypothetical protein